MFQPSLPNTTRRSPVKTNPEPVGRTTSFPQNEPAHSIRTLRFVWNRQRGSISAIAAVLLLFFFVSACEDPGGVGSGLLDESAGLDTRTVEPGEIEPLPAESFSGRLRHMAIGQYDDPLFGSFRSIGILKPSIDTTRIGTTIEEGEKFQLQIAFRSSVYGDPSSTARFEIYRLEDVWRGNEIRFGDDFPIDRSERLAEFSVFGTETVHIDLPGSWIEEYLEFLSNSDEDRDSVYRDQFPGLAIVPAEESSKVLFASMRPAAGEEPDEENLVRFVLVVPNGEEESESEEDEDDDPRVFQGLADWGTFGTRAEPQDRDPNSFYLYNTLESVLRVETSLDEEKLGSRNLATVQLVFRLNRDLLESSLPSGHTRPEVTQLRIHRIPSDRIGEWIYSQPAQFVATRQSGSDTFRFDITTHANSILFDRPLPGNFYLSAQTVDGRIFPVVLHNGNAPEALRPKIVITSINTDRTGL